jgi:hypothetical protein
MAKVKDIFGTGISGKLNQVVFYQRNGQTYVRALPIRKKLTVSAAQVLNKQRFGAMITFARQFKYALIPQVWDHACKTLTGRQLFLRTNKGAFDPGGNIPDMAKVQLSVGKLHLPDGIILKPKADAPTLMMVSWYPDIGEGSTAYWDELMANSYGEGLFSDLKATNIHRGENL